MMMMMMMMRTSTFVLARKEGRRRGAVPSKKELAMGIASMDDIPATLDANHCKMERMLLVVLHSFLSFLPKVDERLKVLFHRTVLLFLFQTATRGECMTEEAAPTPIISVAAADQQETPNIHKPKA